MSKVNEWVPWLGRTTTTSAVIDVQQANRMAVTLDREPRFKSGAPLPPAWHWLYFHDFVKASHLGRDGHPALGVTMPPVPLERRMWAAGELTFHRPLRLGEEATRSSTIADLTPKEGRTGRLFFVTLEHEVHAEGDVAVREKQVIVYKDPSPPPAGQEPGVRTVPDPEFSRSWRVDPTTLFRYSALTFNGHRIHYDADYAREAEGYPDLVVQGPLLATLLMDLAHERSPGDLARFSYQARSPLFVTEPFSTSGRSTPNGVDLWAATDDGRVAMTASATYQQEIR